MCRLKLPLDGTYIVECGFQLGVPGGYKWKLYIENVFVQRQKSIVRKGDSWHCEGGILIGEEKSGELLPNETATWEFEEFEVIPLDSGFRHGYCFISI